MDSFEWKKMIEEAKGKKLVKIEKYPEGIDQYDQLIIDLFFNLEINEKNMSASVFEKTIMRDYIQQTTSLNFQQRLKRLNDLNIPIKMFAEESIALKIGFNKKKSEKI